MRVAPIVVGAIAVGVATTAWVVITSLADGTTYHMFPLLIGATGPSFAGTPPETSSRPSRRS